MAETQAPAARSDAEIMEDVERMVYNYPPLNQDRHHINCAVQNGTVVVSGHIRTWNTRRYIEIQAPQISGVTGLDFSRLYDDDTIRLEVGKLIPSGAIANVEYGTVVLTGRLPDATSGDNLAATLGSVPGVRRVVTAFRP